MLLPQPERTGELQRGGLVQRARAHRGPRRRAAQHGATWSVPAARIVLIVPAFVFAMSPVDIATGHVRRYTKKTMRAALTEAGLTVERLHYANALGLIGYYMATNVFRLMPKEGPMVKVYDSLVLPVTKAAEQRRPAAVRAVGLRRRPGTRRTAGLTRHTAS